MDEPRHWFRAWIKYHQDLNPHKEWRRYEAPGFPLIYRPWVRAFRARGVSLEDARAASERMAAEDSLYPEKHLPRVLKLAARIKEQREADRRSEQTLGVLLAGRLEAKRQARIKELWAAVPEEVKETYREWARTNNPPLAAFPANVEWSSRNRWFDLNCPSRKQLTGA